LFEIFILFKENIMHGLLELVEMNAKEALKRKVLRLKKSKGFQRQQYYVERGKYLSRHGVKL